jgi:diketogulonate reductase-like aldo/keto reductase
MTCAPTIEPADGVHMPCLIYGTAWKEDATADCVVTALRQGFRGIDTACQPRHYSESGVGEGLARSLGDDLQRADIYLQTKFSPLNAQDPSDLPYAADAPIATQVADSFRCSLTNLRTDYLDGLILHAPLATKEATLEAWRALEAIAATGQLGLLGASNFYSLPLFEALYDAAIVKPAILQNRFYRATGFDRELREFCRQHGVVYQSFWTLTANPDLLGDRHTQQIAEWHGITPAQVLFRYLTRQGVVPLTGTTSVAHMQDDLAIFDVELDAAELARLSELLV